MRAPTHAQTHTHRVDSHNYKLKVSYKVILLLPPSLLSLSAQLSIACWADFPPSFIIVAMCCTMNAHTFHFCISAWSQCFFHICPPPSSACYFMPLTHTVYNDYVCSWHADWYNVMWRKVQRVFLIILFALWNHAMMQWNTICATI